MTIWTEKSVSDTKAQRRKEVSLVTAANRKADVLCEKRYDVVRGTAAGLAGRCVGRSALKQAA